MIGVRRRMIHDSFSFVLIDIFLKDVWGFADVEAGINAIPEWMHQVGWERQGIDLEKWVISGHSNGGNYLLYDVLFCMPLFEL